VDLYGEVWQTKCWFPIPITSLIAPPPHVRSAGQRYGRIWRNKHNTREKAVALSQRMGGAICRFGVYHSDVECDGFFVGSSLAGLLRPKLGHSVRRTISNEGWWKTEKGSIAFQDAILKYPIRGGINMYRCKFSLIAISSCKGSLCRPADRAAACEFIRQLEC